MTGLVVGKRIPIGAAVTGLITFIGDVWNTSHPEMALSVAAWGGLAAMVTAIVQLCVANIWGVTNASEPKN